MGSAGFFALSGAGGASDAYTGLRNLALGMRPDVFGASAAPSNRPYGVVTDIAIGDAVATVVANSDGHASIYLSTGGGFLGGEGNENVSAAAKVAVAAAASALSEMHPTKEYPLLAQGHVRFYVLTTTGVMTAASCESGLSETNQPLGRLYTAVQDVITQYRLIQPGAS